MPELWSLQSLRSPAGPVPLPAAAGMARIPVESVESKPVRQNDVDRNRQRDVIDDVQCRVLHEIAVVPKHVKKKTPRKKKPKGK